MCLNAHCCVISVRRSQNKTPETEYQILPQEAEILNSSQLRSAATVLQSLSIVAQLPHLIRYNFEVGFVGAM